MFTEIFDVIGGQVYFYSDGVTRYEERSYRSCVRPAASSVSVVYENARLVYKSAFWG